jgi:iron complex transport system substrate-binding protein
MERIGRIWIGALLCVILTTGNSLSAQTRREIVVKDPSGSTIRLKHPAQRIISLVPSATEMLIALGVGDRIVGRTIYDNDPALRHIQSVGEGLEPNLETIISLRPDLVIGWAAEKKQKIQKRLEAAGIPVLHLSTQDTSDVYNGIVTIGRLTGRDTSAARIINTIRQQFAQVAAAVQGKPRLKILYLTSAQPGITTSPRTYIGQIIGILGGVNLFSDVKQNWFRVSLEEVARRNPDYIIVPSSQSPSKAIAQLESTPGWRSLDAIRNKRIIVIKSDLINRPGPRVGQIAQELYTRIYGTTSGKTPLEGRR